MTINYKNLNVKHSPKRQFLQMTLNLRAVWIPLSLRKASIMNRWHFRKIARRREKS